MNYVFLSKIGHMALLLILQNIAVFLNPVIFHVLAWPRPIYHKIYHCIENEKKSFAKCIIPLQVQRYTYRVLQTIQMKLIFLCAWAERVVLGSAKTALKFKHKI